MRLTLLAEAVVCDDLDKTGASRVSGQRLSANQGGRWTRLSVLRDLRRDVRTPCCVC